MAGLFNITATFAGGGGGGSGTASFGALTRTGEGGVAVTGTAISSGDPSGHWQIAGGKISPSASGEDAISGTYNLTLDDASTIDITVQADAAHCDTLAQAITLASLMHSTSLTTDWSVIFRDGVIEAASDRTLSGLTFMGTLTDPNRAAIDTAEASAESDPDAALVALMIAFDKDARPTISGGSLTLKAENVGQVRCERTLTISNCKPILVEGIGLANNSIVPQLSGSFYSDVPAKAAQSLVIDDTDGNSTEVWVHQCQPGNGPLFDDATLTPPAGASEAVLWNTAIDLTAARKCFITDCQFDGAFNAVTDRQCGNFIFAGNYCTGRRQNDIVTHVQSAATKSGIARKHIQQYGNTVPPWIENTDYADPHQDFCQIGAAADTVDYFVLLSFNRVVAQQFQIQSSSIAAGIYTRGFSWNNFAATFTKWAGAFHRADPTNLDFWAARNNTGVLYTSFSEIRDGTLTGLRASLTIASDSVLPSIKNCIYEAVVLTPGSLLARDDNTVPDPPTAWGSGIDVDCNGNAYVRSRHGDSGSVLENYEDAFAGGSPGATVGFTYETADAGEDGTIWTFDTTNRAAFEASVDALFAPKALSAADGKGHLA